MSKITSCWWKYFFVWFSLIYLFQLLSQIYCTCIGAVWYHPPLFGMTVSLGPRPSWMPFPKSFSASLCKQGDKIFPPLWRRERGWEWEGKKRVQLGQMHSILLGHKGQLVRLPALKEAATGWQRLWQSSSASPGKSILVPSCSAFRLGLASRFYLEDRNVLNRRSLENYFVGDACMRTAFLLVILRRR